MSRCYKGKIKVVGPDRMCFPVDPKTYEATSCSHYDAYPELPEEGTVSVISYGEYLTRKNQLWDKHPETYYPWCKK